MAEQMWFAHAYTQYPPRKPGESTGIGTERKIALKVYATLVEESYADRYAIYPVDELAETDLPRYHDGTLRYWPRIARLGADLFHNEHEVYSHYMRMAGHREGEMRSALTSYEQQHQQWRRKWMEAMHATEADADKEERRW